MTVVPSPAVDDVLAELGSSQLRRPTTLLELLRRPELSHAALGRFGVVSPDPVIAERIEVSVKYEGYLRRQEVEAERLQRMESVRLPDDLDYKTLGALSNEVREKLASIRPLSLGQAARISGVTPAAVSILATVVQARRRSRSADL